MKISIGYGALCWLAFLLLAYLRITEVISWSWWLVTAPLWGPPAIIAIVGLVVTGIAITIDAKAANRRKWGKL
jgi:hypothetical protein